MSWNILPRKQSAQKRNHIRSGQDHDLSPSDKEHILMSQPLDDVEIMSATVRDNGTMTYTLPDGHIITADLGGEEPDAGAVISWCENVRGIAMSREDAKTEEARNIKESTRKPTLFTEKGTVSPLVYATQQVATAEAKHTHLTAQMQAALDEVDHVTQKMAEAELHERQWQAILDSLELGHPTDADVRLEKTREEP